MHVRNAVLGKGITKPYSSFSLLKTDTHCIETGKREDHGEKKNTKKIKMVLMHCFENFAVKMGESLKVNKCEPCEDFTSPVLCFGLTSYPWQSLA